MDTKMNRRELLGTLAAVSTTGVALTAAAQSTAGAEGNRHPDLVDYYWENVVSKGLAAISRFIERGVQRGEFRATAVSDLPQLLLAPVMLAVIWRILFARQDLDTDKLIATHIDMILTYIKA